MDVFPAVTTILLMGSGFAWVLYRNQRDYNRGRKSQAEQKPDPLAPYVSRVSHVWNGAPLRIRNMMLESSGVTVEENRQLLIPWGWHELPDEVQVALTKFQMLAEFEMANPTLVAEITRSAEKERK